MAARSTRYRRAFCLAAFAAFFAMLHTVGAAALDLDEIKKHGKLVVGTEAAYAPFEFVENGKIVSYDKDVLDSIVKSWGVELEQLDVPFAGILTGLDQKKYDFVCTALIMNPERADKSALTLLVAVDEVAIRERKGDSTDKKRDAAAD